MYCDQCGAQNRLEAKFCRTCGAAIATRGPARDTPRQHEGIPPPMTDAPVQRESVPAVVSAGARSDNRPPASILYVGFGPRFLAYIIDLVLVSGGTVVLMLTMLIGIGDGIAEALGYALTAAYFIYCWGSHGQTLGQKLLGQRVVTSLAPTGGIGYSAAIVRYIGLILSILPFGIGVLVIEGDAEKRGWHDKMAGTHVVRTAAPLGQPVRVLSDLLLILLGFWLAYILRYRYEVGGAVARENDQPFARFLPAALLFGVILLAVFAARNLYRQPHRASFHDEALEVGRGVIVGFGALLAAALFYPLLTPSRLLLLYALVLVMALLLAERLVWHRIGTPARSNATFDNPAALLLLMGGVLAGAALVF